MDDFKLSVDIFLNKLDQENEAAGRVVWLVVRQNGVLRTARANGITQEMLIMLIKHGIEQTLAVYFTDTTVWRENPALIPLSDVVAITNVNMPTLVLEFFKFLREPGRMN